MQINVVAIRKNAACDTLSHTNPSQLKGCRNDFRVWIAVAAVVVACS